MQETVAVQSNDNAAAAAASQQAMWGSAADRSPAQPAAGAASAEVATPPLPVGAAAPVTTPATAAQPEHAKEAEAPTPEMLAKWHAGAARCRSCTSVPYNLEWDARTWRALIAASAPADMTCATGSLTGASGCVRNLSAAQTAGKRPQLSSLLVERTWLQHMHPEFDKQYFGQLQRFLDTEWQAHTVYPPPEMIFRSVVALHVGVTAHVSRSAWA